MQKNQFEKMAMPWVESPFFADILKKKTKNLKLEKIAKFFNKNGGANVSIIDMKQYSEERSTGLPTKRRATLQIDFTPR